MRCLRLAMAIGFTLSGAACEQPAVGNKCFLGEVRDGGVDPLTVVASPSVDCTSRMCLRVPVDQGAILPDGSEHADLCTNTCETDGDCEMHPSSPCVGGFTCTTATIKGPFCCEKLCVCRDYLQETEGAREPAACDPGNELNTCCNLPGRADLPQCS